MTLLPFPQPQRDLEDLLEAHRAPDCDLVMSNAGEMRRYRVHRGLISGEWRCELWHGSVLQATTATDFAGAQQVAAHYRREIATLHADGWKEYLPPGRQD